MTNYGKVRLSSRGQFVIPKEIRAAMRVERGDELVLVLDGESLVLMRADAVARLSRGVLKGTWGKNRQQIDRALHQERQSWD